MPTIVQRAWMPHGQLGPERRAWFNLGTERRAFAYWICVIQIAVLVIAGVELHAVGPLPG